MAEMVNFMYVLYITNKYFKGIRCWKQHLPIKFDNLNEVDKFLERYNLPKLTQKETGNLNSPKEINS